MLLSLALEQHHCHNRRADECSDRVYRQCALEARHTRDDAARKGERRTGEHGGGHHHAVVAGAPYRSAQVWHGKPEEHHWPAVGGDYCHEYAAAADYQKARAAYVETQVARVVLAQHEQVHGLDEEH